MSRSVLLLIADDWSPIAGCYGDPVVHTPNIDALAERAQVFDEAFCVTPSCAASRASLLTGQYPHVHGQYGHCHGVHAFRTHSGRPSIPGQLREAGAVTACIGKRHVEPPVVYPFDHEPEVDGRDPADVAEGLRGVLRSAAGRPFYAHVGLPDPHRHHRGFANWPRPGFGRMRYDPAELPVPPWLPDVPEARDELAAYYEAVSRFDACVGRCLETLAEAGRAADTLVIVTSDHGMPFPGAKASSYDGGHRCPLLIAHPDGRGAGLRCDGLVNWLDLAPTVFDFCGVETPQRMAGRSLLPILGEERPAGWDEVFFSHCFHEVTNDYPYRVLRGRRYKYVYNDIAERPLPMPSDLYRSATWQAVLERGLTHMGVRRVDAVLHQERERLFDLELDPHETTNRFDDPAYADVAREMREKVIDMQRATGDPWLEPRFQRGELDFEPA